MIKEPIIALATPPLKGALALIRLSGEGVISLTSSFFSKKIDPSQGRQLLFGSFSDGKKEIDQVVLLVYPKPNSFTGEDMVEISCHGSMLVVGEIVQAYLSKGVRYATGGEFSSRAFLNGKMDLIQAESINDLINATTKEAKNLALLSLSGEVSKIAKPLKNKIADILSLVEVGIDFPEYDEEEKASNQTIAKKCREICAEIDDLIDLGKQGKVVRNGVNVAIVGKPNVGKSSLLNALLKEDKAIVSPVPGTTRDVVEGNVVIEGLELHLLDTAGIRESSNEIEMVGVNKSNKMIDAADLVLFLTDETESFDEEIENRCKNKKTIKVINKSDLIKTKSQGCVYISCLKDDVDDLKKAIRDSFLLSESSFIAPSFSNERELSCLQRMKGNLLKAKEDAEAGLSMDLISISLQDAYNEARLLLGEEKTLDLTDEIFSRFCVGK